MSKINQSRTHNRATAAVRNGEGELSIEEMESAHVEELPDREAMSLINANLVAPVNAAVAANVLSDDSVAIANAQQDVQVDQTT